MAGKCIQYWLEENNLASFKFLRLKHSQTVRLSIELTSPGKKTNSKINNYWETQTLRVKGHYIQYMYTLHTTYMYNVHAQHVLPIIAHFRIIAVALDTYQKHTHSCHNYTNVWNTARSAGNITLLWNDVYIH